VPPNAPPRRAPGGRRRRWPSSSRAPPPRALGEYASFAATTSRSEHLGVLGADRLRASRTSRSPPCRGAHGDQRRPAVASSAVRRTSAPHRTIWPASSGPGASSLHLVHGSLPTVPVFTSTTWRFEDSIAQRSGRTRAPRASIARGGGRSRPRRLCVPGPPPSPPSVVTAHTRRVASSSARRGAQGGHVLRLPAVSRKKLSAGAKPISITPSPGLQRRPCSRKSPSMLLAARTRSTSARTARRPGGPARRGRGRSLPPRRDAPLRTAAARDGGAGRMPRRRVGYASHGALDASAGARRRDGVRGGAGLRPRGRAATSAARGGIPRRAAVQPLEAGEQRLDPLELSRPTGAQTLPAREHAR